jgi:hypothetical protein
VCAISGGKLVSKACAANGKICSVTISMAAIGFGAFLGSLLARGGISAPNLLGAVSVSAL